jgi:hypothetical protein
METYGSPTICKEKKMARTFKYLVLTICITISYLFAACSDSDAATYFVDFDNGSDARDGLSQATSWRNIPGTRTASNSGTVSGATGWKKIAAGDTIQIRPGTIHNSSEGGRIFIDSTWYGNGTAVSPITIKADTTWGSGQILIDGTGVTVPSWSGLFEIKGIPYVVLDGVADKGIKIQNSAYYGFATSGNYNTIRFVEAYNSKLTNVLFTSNSYPTTYLQGGKIDHVVAHKTNTNDDWASNIYLNYVDGALVTDSISYDSNTGGDGIHLGSCKNSWIVRCTAYRNGEQGIDISRDGDYKTRDDSYNITVRDSVAYDNYKQNFDSNSASRDIYFINNVAWRTTTTEGGDGNFMVYEAGNRVFFINCTSSAGRDYGFGIAWWSQYYNLTSGTYSMYIINSISSGDSGRSVYVENDLSGRSYSVKSFNSIFNSPVSGTAVTDKGINYTKDNINNATGGWTGTGCKAVDPLFNAVGTSWDTTNLGLRSTSPGISAGVFPFTTSAAGSGSTITLNKLVSDLDASKVFRAGDRIQIEGGGQYIVASASNNQLTLTSSATWQAGKGVWFPWPNQKLDVGAMAVAATGSAPDPVNGLIPPVLRVVSSSP